MGKFDGVLLVSDYDDTLYCSDYSVSEENRAAILHFIEKGGYFSIATGRAHTTFAPQICRERLSINAPVVLSNGSAVFDFESDCMLFQTFLPSESAHHLIMLAEAFPALGFEAYHGEDVYVHNGNSVTWAHLKRAGVGCVQCPIAEMPLPWTKVIFQQEHELLLQVQAHIQEYWKDQYEAIFSNRRMLELTARGSTKGDAVLFVAGHLGVERSHIYCVGDNQNDIPMLAVSAVPFAPSNCAREVRDWGATIVSSCDEHCVAQIIGLLEKRYESRP